MADQQNHQDGDDQVHLSTLIRPIIVHKWMIAIIVGLGLLLSGVYLALRPELYTATVSILPESGSAKSYDLPSFAGMVGLSLPENSELRILPDLLRSNSLLNRMYGLKFDSDEKSEQFTLSEIWGVPESDSSRRMIIQDIKGNVIQYNENSSTGLISIYVQSENGVFAASFANRLAEELNDFLIRQKKTKASEQRKWIESRIQELQMELTKKESELQAFLETNISIETPALILKHQRFLREVEMIKQVYIELKKQLEAVKIQEIKESPLLQVLDSALVPTETSNSSAFKILVLTFIASLLLGSCLAYLLFFVKNSEDFREIKKMILSREQQ